MPRFIPPRIGMQLLLTQPWSFRVRNVSYNASLLRRLNIHPLTPGLPSLHLATLQPGTELKVLGVFYRRAPLDPGDTVAFQLLKQHDGSTFYAVKFVVDLDALDTLEFELLRSTASEADGSDT